MIEALVGQAEKKRTGNCVSFAAWIQPCRTYKFLHQ